MNIRDKIVKFPDNDGSIYISKMDKNVFRKVAEENKMNTIEGLNSLKTVGENKKGFSEHQYNRALVASKFYHMLGAPTLQNLKMMIRNNIIQN